MGIDELPQLAERLIRLVNLVSFDSIHATAYKIQDTANPLTKELYVPILHEIPKGLHAPLRKGIKSECHRSGAYSGKIRFGAYLIVTIYLKRRLSPAWKRQDQSSEEQLAKAVSAENQKQHP